jgi:hypothetical protein
MSSRLKQWITVILFVGIFIYTGYNRIQLKHVSISVALLFPFCFIFAFLLYRYIKEEMSINKSKLG